MNEDTNKLFEKHIRQLEAMAIAGDETSIKSLCCMAIIVGDGPEGGGKEDIGGAEIIILERWRNAA